MFPEHLLGAGLVLQGGNEAVVGTTCLLGTHVQVRDINETFPHKLILITAVKDTKKSERMATMGRRQ